MKPGPCAIDFETAYSDECSIKPLGVDAYLRHPQCDIYLVSIVGDEGEEFVGHPDEFDWDSLIGRELYSHNAAFDRRVYHYLRERSLTTEWETDDDGHTTGVENTFYALPDLETPLWQCTANLAVYHRAGRSLKAACAALLGIEITKDVRDAMKGKTAEMARQSPPIAPGFANLYEEVCAYALSDAKLCRQLAVEFGPSWPESERALSDITTRSCHVGLPLDVPALETGQALLQTKIWEIDNRLPWVAEGKPATSPKALAEECRKAGIVAPASMAEDDERCVAWEAEYGETYPWVADIRDRRKSNILLKKVDTLLTRQNNGWFCYGLKYGGAHTLRWSGDGGYNVQNPPKEPMVFDDGQEFDLRSCIRAPEGYTFIIADLAQIEARITPYLAGDEKTIELIAGGMSIYEVHARLTMGWTGGVLKKENPDLYKLAKFRVLGLGFGCGGPKFQVLAQRGGIELTLAEAKKQVKDFRDSNPKIVRLWNRLENDFRASVGGNYELELPSNRVMTFFDVSVGSKIPAAVDGDPKGDVIDKALGFKAGKPGYRARTEIGGRFKWMYGGLLAENLVQATARDVFGEALINLDREGFQIIFHVHDEVTVMVREEDSDDSKKRVEEILSRTPSWLPGCPIGCEVNVSRFYEK